MSASTTFNDTVITEFRATGGRVDSTGFGDRLVLLHTTGRRSGRERINPVMAIPDGDAWLVTASAAHNPPPPELPAPTHERLGPPLGPNRNERGARVTGRIVRPETHSYGE